MGKGKSLDAPNPMTLEFESEERKDEKPARLFQQCYTRKNKYATVISSLGFNTLNDATMPLDDTSETNPEVHVPSPLTLEIAILNPQVGDQGRRYPLRDRKEYDKLGFSKLSSNVVYPIYDSSVIIVYLRLALFLLFNCLLCLLLVIFKKPLKILSGSLQW